MSPPVDRSLRSLHPMFRAPFEAWLDTVSRSVPHVEFRVTEAGRSFARQEWLFAQGRRYPHERNPVVTWTLDSRHRWGLAADIAMIRRSTGDAIWEVSSWKWVYERVPVEWYGLRTLAPREYAHIEYRYASEAITEAATLGLVQS